MSVCAMWVCVECVGVCAGDAERVQTVGDKGWCAGGGGVAGDAG